MTFRKDYVLIFTLFVAVLSGWSVSSDPFSTFYNESRFFPGSAWALVEEPFIVLLEYSLISLVLFVSYKQSLHNLDFVDLFYVVLGSYVIEALAFFCVLGIYYFELKSIRIFVLLLPYLAAMVQSVYVIHGIGVPKGIIKRIPYYATAFTLIMITSHCFFSVYDNYIM